MRRQKILSDFKKKLPSVYWHQIAQNPRYYNTLLEISFFSLHPSEYTTQTNCLQFTYRYQMPQKTQTSNYKFTENALKRTRSKNARKSPKGKEMCLKKRRIKKRKKRLKSNNLDEVYTSGHGPRRGRPVRHIHVRQ